MLRLQMVRRLFLYITITFLASLLAGLYIVMPVRAATTVVNTSLDEDVDNEACSLREAIIAANTDTAYNGCAAGSGADTITFAAHYVITLAGSQLPVVTSEIAVIGDGVENTVIQASICNPVVLPDDCTPASYRVFDVGDTGNLTLAGLTIQYGQIADGYGGGIMNSGTLTLVNILLSDNLALSGGGIYNISNSLMMSNSTLSGNVAGEYGGGIYNDSGTVTLDGSLLSGNRASWRGGALLNTADAALWVIESTFSSNIADNGGGIDNQGTITIAHSTFYDNSANMDSGVGGGILNNGYGNLEIINTTISGNDAVNGGGIWSNWASSVTIAHSTLYGNTANTGGGILTWGTVSIYNSIVADSMGGDCVGTYIADNNLAEDACGTLPVSGLDPVLKENGGVTMTHALLPDSNAIDAGMGCPPPDKDQRGVLRPQGTACDIGAVEFEGTPSPPSNCSEAGLYAAIAEGGSHTFECTEPTTILISRGTRIISNTVTLNGGGLLTISGGGLDQVFLVTESGSLTLENLAVTGGKANYGGGIYVANGYLNVSNSKFYDNFATYAGGGIYNTGGEVVINASAFTDNTAQTGGGVYNWGVLTVIDSTFSNNSSTYIGGGIRSSGGSTTIANSTFSHNSALDSGGGIHNQAALAITNSTFFGNGAGSGGALYNWSGVMDVTNSTFSGNFAEYGGGIYRYSGVAVLKNTIVADSTSGGDCSGGINADVYNLDTDGTCEIATTQTSAHIKLGALKNNGGLTDTMALQVGSYALDAGNGADCPVSDQRGMLRPKDGDFDGTVACDIGAYEADPKLVVSDASYDGWVLESSETSGLGGTLNKNATTLRVGDDAANKQYRSILFFDTSSLPEGAVITSVTLKFKFAGKTGTLPFSTHGKLLADICEGAFKNNSALQLGDFNARCPSGLYKAKSLLYTNTKVDSWYSQMLLPDDFQFINLGGVTQFRLRFAGDDNNDFGADFLKLFSGNAAEADRPQLVIEYYVP